MKNSYGQSLAKYQQSMSIHNIKAPMSGVITDTSFAVGQVISPQDILANLVNPDNLVVRYQLPSQFFGKAKLGQLIVFQPTDSPSDFPGQVTYVSPQINPQTGTLHLIAKLQTKKTFLRIGLDKLSRPIIQIN